MTNDPDTLLARFLYAKGFHDAAHEAFRRAPSDDTSKLRTTAVMRFAAAQKALLGDKE